MEVSGARRNYIVQDVVIWGCASADLHTDCVAQFWLAIIASVLFLNVLAIMASVLFLNVLGIIASVLFLNVLAIMASVLFLNVLGIIASVLFLNMFSSVKRCCLSPDF